MIPEFTHDAQVIRDRIPECQRGQSDTVESSGFYHRIVGHIVEDQALADLQGLPETIIAHYIPRKATQAAQTVGKWQLPGGAGTEDMRAVGHLQRVGHVAGGGRVENGNIRVIAHDIKHLADQHAGAYRDGLSRLDVDLNTVLRAETLDPLDQAVDVVRRMGDVVAAAEIDPLHLVQQVRRLRLDRIECAGQRREVLFAQRVEVQAADAGEVLIEDLADRRAKP